MVHVKLKSLSYIVRMLERETIFYNWNGIFTENIFRVTNYSKSIACSQQEIITLSVLNTRFWKKRSSMNITIAVRIAINDLMNLLTLISAHIYCLIALWKFPKKNVRVISVVIRFRMVVTTLSISLIFCSKFNNKISFVRVNSSYKLKMAVRITVFRIETTFPATNSFIMFMFSKILFMYCYMKRIMYWYGTSLWDVTSHHTS